MSCEYRPDSLSGLDRVNGLNVKSSLWTHDRLFLVASLWHCRAEVCGFMGFEVRTMEQGRRALSRGPMAGLAAWNTVQLASLCVLPAYNYQRLP